MGRNIIIFSDGTGQAGGITFDERRSNIYKLYRATRCGPDSSIDPQQQAAFYDPGLGSPLDGGGIYRGIARGIYTAISQATGFGITANIVDCYAALIRMWRPGDRIFLFGFSRGAYTVRCLAGVLRHCGIPTQMPDGGPVPLDPYGSRKLASYAVKHIYQFTTSRRREKATPRQLFLLDARTRLARKFRADYGSADPAIPDRPNVVPYFIGVFDTVASLMDPGKLAALAGALLASIVIPAAILIAVFNSVFGISWLPLAIAFVALPVALALLIYFYTHTKMSRSVPGFSPCENLQTLHLTDPFQTFEDKTLDAYVPYAKHALSIDENRKPFARVPWFPDEKPVFGERDDDDNIRFEQVWFAGVHSDIGGSYVEEESRLSDIPLKWMLDWATAVPDGLTYDPAVLHIHPDPLGLQHDARRDGFGPITRWFGLTYHRSDRKLFDRAVLHPSVYDRLNASEVALYDRRGPYRPTGLAGHVDTGDIYRTAPDGPAPRATTTQVCQMPPKASAAAAPPQAPLQTAPLEGTPDITGP